MLCSFFHSFFQKNVSKKASQKARPAQVPELLPLGSPRDPEKANIKEQQCLSSFLVSIRNSISFRVQCLCSLSATPLSVPSQHLCCFSSWLYHFHTCLTYPLLPSTPLTRLQLVHPLIVLRWHLKHTLYLPVISVLGIWVPWLLICSTPTAWASQTAQRGGCPGLLLLSVPSPGQSVWL